MVSVTLLLSVISFSKALNLTCKSVAWKAGYYEEIYPIDVCYREVWHTTTTREYYCSSSGDPMVAGYGYQGQYGYGDCDYRISNINMTSTAKTNDWQLSNGCDPELPPCDYLIRRTYTAFTDPVTNQTNCDPATNKITTWADRIYVVNVCFNREGAGAIPPVSYKYTCDQSG